jgi:hypothetical protein
MYGVVMNRLETLEESIRDLRVNLRAIAPMYPSIDARLQEIEVELGNIRRNPDRNDRPGTMWRSVVRRFK